MSHSKSKPTPAGRKRQNRVILLCVIALVLTVAVVNINGLVNSYYDSFVLRGDDISEATSHLGRLIQPDAAALEPLQAQWDSWRYSRLRDEVSITAEDGTVLHAYYYHEDSDVTAVYVPRFDADAGGDFLMGPWVNQATGCNILLLDQRLHGESGGTFFSYGRQEGADLAAWLDWADETLGKQTFLLFGEGSGANTILFAAAGGLLEGRAAFAVAESPFASLHELAGHLLWAGYQLPGFPFLNLMEWKFDRENGGLRAADLELGSALEGADCSLPVLFLGSDGDEYILPAWTQAAWDAYSGPKELISGGLGHGTVCAARMEDIQALLTGWLEGLS